jgi:hypothetical protein
MKKSAFTDEQIAYALKQAETGTPVVKVVRRMGVAEQTSEVLGASRLRASLAPSLLDPSERYKRKRLIRAYCVYVLSQSVIVGLGAGLRLINVQASWQERPPAPLPRALPRLRNRLRGEVCFRLRQVPPPAHLSFSQGLRCLRRLGERYRPHPLPGLRLRLLPAILLQVILPLPILRTEAGAPSRRVPGRGSPPPPAAPAVCLDDPQSAAGFPQARSDAVRRSREADLHPDR